MRWLLRAGICACLLAACSDPSPVLEPLPDVDLESLGANLAEPLAPLISKMRAEPRDAEVAGMAGMLLQAYEQHALAIAFFARAQALSPRELRWEYYLGISLGKLGRQEEAAVSFRGCIEIDEGFLPARRRLAEATFEANDLATSLEMYRSLVTLAPGDARIPYGLGRVEAALGQAGQARDHLLRAIELAPSYGAAHYALAQTYREQDMTAEASRHLELFERNEHGAPPDDDPLIKRVNSLRVTAAEFIKRGVQAKDAGHGETAIALHLKALEEDPTLVQARVNLVILYGSLGRTQEAEEQYRMGLEGGATSAELHYNYGVLAYQEGRSHAAREAFLKALELSPDHALANHNLGQLLEEEGRFDDAMARYQRALANRPDHGLSHYKVGMLWVRRRRAAEAVRAFREAAKEQSDRTPTYLFSLAGALLASGARDEARIKFRQARELDERYSRSELIGRIDEALQALEPPPKTQ